MRCHIVLSLMSTWRFLDSVEEQRTASNELPEPGNELNEMGYAFLVRFALLLCARSEHICLKPVNWIESSVVNLG